MHTLPAGTLLSFAGGSNGALEAWLVAAVGLTGAGFLIDWLSGAMYDRDVHEVMIDLEH